MIETDGDITIEWHSGEPPSQGWYDCLLNGEELRLQWWICYANHRKRHWKDAQGAYRETEGEVLWTGTASTTQW